MFFLYTKITRIKKNVSRLSFKQATGFLLCSVSHSDCGMKTKVYIG